MVDELYKVNNMIPDDENMRSIAVIRFYAITGFKPSRSAQLLNKRLIRKLAKASREANLIAAVKSLKAMNSSSERDSRRKLIMKH